MEAEDLERGDRIRKADGSYGEVKSLKLVERKQRMYNLTVDIAPRSRRGRSLRRAQACYRKATP